MAPGMRARLLSTGEKVHVMHVLQGSYLRNGKPWSFVYGAVCRLVERSGEPIVRLNTKMFEPLPDAE